ncbi:hypothetical protein [Cupriavidus sp. DL-D2]|uniref:hypothetical protein n=1 Tax=Cupriavidus sp. DL-D2 TaxID=3144974 RepID=UPI003212A00E
MSSSEILAELKGVRERSYGEWTSFCPLCAVRKHRLLIREDAAGQTDIHCFRGHEDWEILQAIGKTRRALWPRPPHKYHAPDQEWWDRARLFANGKRLPPMSEQ